MKSSIKQVSIQLTANDMQTATLQLLLPVCLAYCVLGAPSTQLSVYQDQITISPGVLHSIEDIIEDQVRSSLANAYLGRFPEMAATSCKEIAKNKPDYQSGYYWIREPAGPVGVYCDMEPPFEQDGGWMRVAAVDMSDKNSQCPAGLVCDVISNKRTCGRSERFANGGCASIVLPVHNAPYKKVCGKVIGYQNKRPNGFGPSRENLLINETYVDGISITHGHPRQHIWTFAAATGDSVAAGYHTNCPCLDYSQSFTGSIPNFVGNDYFCETGNRASPEEASAKYGLFTEDPLWDGKGCEGTNMCCNRGGPWFCKELSKTTCDDIELRICTNAEKVYEDVLLEKIAIYVQ